MPQYVAKPPVQKEPFLVVQLLEEPLVAEVERPAGLMATLITVRTFLEDATPQRELPGYAEYTCKFRYRLLPGVW